MGYLFKAKCPCGFEDNVMVGCGMTGHCYAPLACPTCHTLWKQDEKWGRRTHCRKCNTLVYYLEDAGSFTGDPEFLRLREIPDEDNYCRTPWDFEANWEYARRSDPSKPECHFSYRCPKCDQLTLRLIHEGTWD